MASSILNDRQRAALHTVLSGHNLLILGAAGTGKSFLVKEIVRRCVDQGKRVSLTCTTGIACSVYNDLSTCGVTGNFVQTVHKWSGIDDGRYSSSEIKHVLKNNAKYAKTVATIIATDILIVDECSMLSKKLFNCLGEVCTLKNEHLLFGGIQLVLCGDFFQLAPVPNSLYNEDGDYCFSSGLFSKVLPHRVTLVDVFRQEEIVFKTVILEATQGSISDESVHFIQSLNRPLQLTNRNDSIKLFSTNDHVDDFNRDQLIKLPGDVYEYVSTDTGKSKFLQSILAPKKLWLKINAPVILLRNLSEKLVNGLRGYVVDIKDNGPLVKFPSVVLTVPIQKMKFSVFSPRENKDIAVREQLPLKLAYAITIHKAQGMTLDNVEVDCDGIFKPGQLGVAISRARTSEGLRVVNFSKRACLSHPETILQFYQLKSALISEDKQCCQVPIRLEKSMHTVCASDAQDIYAIDADIDVNYEEEFDQEFDDIMAAIDVDETDIELPADLNIDEIISKLKTDMVYTPFQEKTNRILSTVSKLKYKQFCQREYKHILGLVDKMKFEGPVRCKALGEFYSAIHVHHNSGEFVLSCMQMFENESFQPEHKHICFNISVEIRKFILDEKSELYPSKQTKSLGRSVTNASRARIRYIGGYCIAKLRLKYLNKKKSLRFCKTPEQQKQYSEAKFASRIINKLCEDEQYILSNSAEPDSLLDTYRRQNVNRGLTNISDNVFNCFIKLSELSLVMLSTDNLNKYGSTMFEHCKTKIIENEDLFDSFESAIKTQCFDDNNNDLSLTDDNIDKQKMITLLFQKIVKHYLLVITSQFRRDVLDTYQIEKKMAHRKQIQVSGKKKKKSVTESECENKSSKKSGLESKNDKLSIPIEESEYVPVQSTSQWQGDSDPVASTSQWQGDSDPVASTSQWQGDSDPVASTSQWQGDSDPVASTSQWQGDSDPVASTSQWQGDSDPVQSTSQVDITLEQDEDEDDVLCRKCFTADKESEWIQCDNCSVWLHRTCAGLRHHLRWKKYQKKNSVFNCSECL